MSDNTGRSKAATASLTAGAWGGVVDFAQLTKLRLSSTVVLSSVLAYFIAAPLIDWPTVSMLTLGGFCVTMAANAFNQILEREYDHLMDRTAERPLPTGRMQLPWAILSAGILSIAGTFALASIGPLAALLGMVALLSYAFVYTPLKRQSVAAVFVGTVPGAIPAMIGVVAVTGGLDELAWSLFAIQVCWQIPHFWAIGWLGFDDYRRAGFKLLPTTESGERDPGTGLQAAVFGLALTGLVWLPFMLGYFSLMATVLSSVLGLAYAYYGWNLYRERNRASALRLMFFSLAYLPLVFGLGWLA